MGERAVNPSEVHERAVERALVLVSAGVHCDTAAVVSLGDEWTVDDLRELAVVLAAWAAAFLRFVGSPPLKPSPGSFGERIAVGAVNAEVDRPGAADIALIPVGLDRLAELVPFLTGVTVRAVRAAAEHAGVDPLEFWRHVTLKVAEVPGCDPATMIERDAPGTGWATRCRVCWQPTLMRPRAATQVCERCRDELAGGAP
jgi:hypothetical protein